MSRVQRLVASLAVVIGAAAFGQFVGCASAQSLLGDKDTRTLIERCTDEGREAHATGASIEQAGVVFDKCIARGLKDGGS